MKLNFDAYRDKVYACWTGKNIGGTMGAPFEGKREFIEIDGFTTQAGVVLPNDDLDLQLVWLYALEQNGPNAISTQMLGEHWLSFITPHWNEYGHGKMNMRRGLPPPMSGDYLNDWQNSNGAWIRTEIWACVAPAMPHVAARYAMMDAMVDHGTGEGTYAAAFVAAMQSAAFAIPDLKKCIEVGMNAIPEGSRMAKSIEFVLKCYDEGMSWRDARNAVQQLNADIGNGWFEAPSNVSYAVIGLLWGEGDFKKSMIIAIGCGDDTDCTGATCGATLGILHGTEKIPVDWRKHIGDDIVTISIARGNNGRSLPDTCRKLTDRVCAVCPSVLYANSIRFTNWGHTNVFYEWGVELDDNEDIPEDCFERFVELASGRARKWAEDIAPNSVMAENLLFTAILSLGKEPFISRGEEISARLTLESHCYFESEPRAVEIRWILPEGFVACGPMSALIKDFNPHNCGRLTLEYSIRAGEALAPTNEIVLEIKPVGRCSPLFISFPLFG
ncbi:MAG: ADP-ribosylglycohydrolase family protein [Clostridia bacterium]|nr:ADP-ribosylglycohydrolase family protein [Clostridia bacterium]